MKSLNTQNLFCLLFVISNSFSLLHARILPHSLSLLKLIFFKTIIIIACFLPLWQFGQRRRRASCRGSKVRWPSRGHSRTRRRSGLSCSQRDSRDDWLTTASTLPCPTRISVIFCYPPPFTFSSFFPFQSTNLKIAQKSLLFCCCFLQKTHFIEGSTKVSARLKDIVMHVNLYYAAITFEMNVCPCLLFGLRRAELLAHGRYM